MRPLVVAAGALAATLTMTACGAETSGAPAPRQSTVTSEQPPTAGPCSYTATPDEPAPPGRDVGLPPQDESAVPTSVVLTLNGGKATVTLSTKAPCTTRSFAHLAAKKYYDGSPCHRLTTTQQLRVLQCGDPTGTGMGGPGYTIPDENPTDLPPSPTSPDASLYARGTVAMANTGQPHSGGSQFFIVYGDSSLNATYAVIGTIDAAGLTVVDGIAAVGVDQEGMSDGPPKNPVTITQAVVGS